MTYDICIVRRSIVSDSITHVGMLDGYPEAILAANSIAAGLWQANAGTGLHVGVRPHDNNRVGVWTFIGRKPEYDSHLAELGRFVS